MTTGGTVEITLTDLHDEARRQTAARFWLHIGTDWPRQLPQKFLEDEF